MPRRVSLAWSLSLTLLSAAALAGCNHRDVDSMPVWTPADHSRQDGTEFEPLSPTTQARPLAPEGDPTLHAARSLWRVSCAACHGDGGAGDGPALTPMMHPPDFTSAAFQRSADDAQLTRSITMGRNLMPPFGDQIPRPGIEALVRLVRSFGSSSGAGHAAPGTAAAGSPPPTAAPPTP
ncbi:MAG: cytochrome c [Myxococcales bacterium]|nr:cytochrome c [Myxococcales bacterium]